MTADGTPRSAERRPLEGKVAVVLINWNGASDTLATLASLEASEEAHRLRCLVVDNGSTDDSVTRLGARLGEIRLNAELIETGANLGFAGGNGVGIRRALEDPSIDWILLLNTDVEVDPGFLKPLLEACADPAVGAAGPLIFYFEPRDLIWAAGGRLRWRETVTEEWGNREPLGPKFAAAADVTYLTTCCLLVPRDAMLEVGPLDPVYFINVDDADWCRRASAAGYRLRYVPESRIWHKVAASTGGGYTPTKTFHTGRGNAIFVRRYGGPLACSIFLAANLAALPVAFVREGLRGNARSVRSKAKGLWRGLLDPLPEPPRFSVHGAAPAEAGAGGRT